MFDYVCVCMLGKYRWFDRCAFIWVFLNILVDEHLLMNTGQWCEATSVQSWLGLKILFCFFWWFFWESVCRLIILGVKRIKWKSIMESLPSYRGRKPSNHYILHRLSPLEDIHRVAVDCHITEWKKGEELKPCFLTNQPSITRKPVIHLPIH